MPRLIDADLLTIYKYEYDIFEEVSPQTAYKEGWNNAIDAIIENAPTVDAEPVRHGRWVEDIMPITGAVQVKCSNCGQVVYVAFNRCPHCGVKIDESKGETKEREDDYEELEINPCLGCEDYDGKGGCLSHGGCAEGREDVSN